MICVGCTENHGKHMPMGTDTLIPDRIAELLEEKCDVMIAPTIPYGATNTIYGCPGTITIGTDEPHLATEEWGKEMLQTMADYIADFIEEYEKIDLPHPAE